MSDSDTPAGLPAIRKPLTVGNWTVRRFRIKGTRPGEADSFGWSILQPDGSERARFASADFMAEHFAMSVAHTDALDTEICRLCEALLRVAARGGDWSYPCLLANVADTLGLTVAALEQLIRED